MSATSPPLRRFRLGFSGWLAILGLLLLLGPLVVTALGWRAHVSSLVGTASVGATIRGAITIALHFASAALAPVLLLAALYIRISSYWARKWLRASSDLPDSPR
jgi:hypothetical protein